MQLLNLEPNDVFAYEGETYRVDRHEMDGNAFIGVTWVTQFTRGGRPLRKPEQHKFNSYAEVKAEK